jgi:phosphoribosylformylglycinamidine cyclo-ligase
VKSALAAVRETGAVKALAHITGGGLPDNLPRVLPKGLGARIDLDSLDPPPVFGWIAREGGVSQEEMLRTFNCGAGLVLVTSPGDADAVRSALEHAEEAPFVLGSVEPRAKEHPVRFTGALDIAS